VGVGSFATVAGFAACGSICSFELTLVCSEVSSDAAAAAVGEAVAPDWPIALDAEPAEVFGDDLSAALTGVSGTEVASAESAALDTSNFDSDLQPLMNAMGNIKTQSRLARRIACLNVIMIY
jgi:hypothetical protein